MRRPLILGLVIGASAFVLHAQTPVSRAPRPTAVSVVEATIPEMQRAMAERRVTSRGLVTEYLTRIGLYEKRINAAI